MLKNFKFKVKGQVKLRSNVNRVVFVFIALQRPGTANRQIFAFGKRHLFVQSCTQKKIKHPKGANLAAGFDTVQGDFVSLY